VLDFHANTVRRRKWLRGLAEAAEVAHELHWLDIPDATCRQRMHERNASGNHPWQLSDADYDQFTRFFVPPTPDEAFNIVIHRD
jgi:predicted kinase